VFFCFEYNKDYWRAVQLCNLGKTGYAFAFSDHAWEEVRVKTNDTIEKWIDEQIKICSCVVVLIGATTATRKWVLYEIEKAYELNKGIVGIFVHKITDRIGYQTGKGKNPFDLVFAHNGKKLSDYVICYNSPRLSSQTVCDDIADHMNDLIGNALKNKVPR